MLKKNEAIGGLYKDCKSSLWFKNDLAKTIGKKPEAILVISAHYEEDEPTLIVKEKPSLYFDYYGFPEHTYQIDYPVPHSKEAQLKIENALKENQIIYKTNNKRGLGKY